MKICLYIPSLEGGGAEKVFVNLANFFASKGVTTILVSSSLGVYGEDINKNVRFVTIANKRYVKHGSLNRILNFVRTFVKLNSIVKKEKPDILFSTLALGNILCFLVKKFTKVNLMLVTRQANVLNTASKNRILNNLLKKAFNHSDLIIANSYNTEESIRDLVKPIKSLNTTVIGNPVYSEQIIKKGNETLDLSFLKYGSYILNVGRLTKEKDQFTLIKAYKEVLKTVKIDLVILGVGPLEKELKELIEELGLSESVHLIGFDANPYRFYKNAKIFALSSNTEGFGNVLVEALAFDLPITSTNCVGGPSFILDNGKYGNLVEVGSIGSFKEALLTNINQPIESGVLINRAKEFSLEKVGSQYYEEFSKLCDSNYKG